MLLSSAYYCAAMGSCQLSAADRELQKAETKGAAAQSRSEHYKHDLIHLLTAQSLSRQYAFPHASSQPACTTPTDMPPRLPWQRPNSFTLATCLHAMTILVRFTAHPAPNTAPEDRPPKLLASGRGSASSADPSTAPDCATPHYSRAPITALRFAVQTRQWAIAAAWQQPGLSINQCCQHST